MAGITETQVNRVALATGSAGDGTGNAVPVGPTNPLPMGGNVASGATDTGNPILIGGYGSSTTPSAVSNGQRVRAWFGLQGQQVVSAYPTGFTGADGQSNTVNGVADYQGNLVRQAVRVEYFNGTTWDRMRGDASGQDMVIAARPTAGGATQFRRLSTADTNAAVVKATAGRVYGYSIANTSASAKFVKLYNKATAPVIGTDVPLRTIMIPAGGIAAYHVGHGLAGFSAGIAIAATGAVADADATALAVNDLVIQIDYA